MFPIFENTCYKIRFAGRTVRPEGNFATLLCVPTSSPPPPAKDEPRLKYLLATLVEIFGNWNSIY